MISYFGGKNKVGEFIYPYIPKKIKTYIEPFSGAMWIYFNLKHDFTDVKTIVYNDLNKYMCNLITCSQDYNKLLKAFEDIFASGELHCTDTPGSDAWKTFYRELYYSYNSTNRKTKDFLDDPKFDIPDYHAAALYCFLLSSTFNGCFPNTSSGAAPFAKDKLKLQSFINKLNNEGYQSKLEGITKFENLDFEQIIKRYDAEDTYFYFDPPYYDPKGDRIDWYGVKDENSFGFQSHKRLVDLMKNTKAKWSLSYYYFEELEEWLPKEQYYWVSKEFHRTSATGAVKEKQTKGEELLIMNYNPTEIECRQPVETTKKKKTTPKKKVSDETVVSVAQETTTIANEEDDFWN